MWASVSFCHSVSTLIAVTGETLLERWFASEADWRSVLLRPREFTPENPLNIDLITHGDAAGSQTFFRVRALHFDGHGIFPSNRTSFKTLIRYAGPEHLISQVQSDVCVANAAKICEWKSNEVILKILTFLINLFLCCSTFKPLCRSF
jgi:hypothetical protein